MLTYLWQNFGNINPVTENNNRNQCIPKIFNHFFKGITLNSLARAVCGSSEIPGWLKYFNLQKL